MIPATLTHPWTWHCHDTDGIRRDPAVSRSARTGQGTAVNAMQRNEEEEPCVRVWLGADQSIMPACGHGAMHVINGVV